ncbi:MAG: hypothetical protein H6608_05285 [Flavobacteriales bacterium]|nr:hypothetical protein [Bacteroidota bacterium]MCB9240518.1 hypothetical protein [Flavobacteriales bacterium]
MMERINKIGQWILITGTVGYMIWCLFDMEYWIMLPALLIPIGAVQYVSSLLLVIFFKTRRFLIHLILATLDLIIFFIGIYGPTPDGVAIGCMFVGLLLALYFMYLTFNADDFETVIN